MGVCVCGVGGGYFGNLYQAGGGGGGGRALGQVVNSYLARVEGSQVSFYESDVPQELSFSC